MSKKIMLLALAAVSAVLFVLPAVASAADWEMTPAGGSYSVTNVGSTKLTSASGSTVTCTTVTGNGQYNAGSATNGTVELTFSHCTSVVLGITVNCTTSGKGTGEITTTTVSFENVYLTDNKTKPGVKLTGAGTEMHFATFACAGVTFVVTGGVYGEGTTPCGTVSKTHGLKFESVSAGTQKWMQNTETNAKEDLTSTRGGTAETASQDGEGTLTFTTTESVTCV